MNAQTLQVTNSRFRIDSHRPEEMKPVTARESWLQEYAGRILGHFLQWQTPLGIAPAYAGKVKSDLAEFYDDPLKRMFIEATF